MAAPVPTNGARILVCDGEPRSLRALKAILGDAGFAVATAASAGEALDGASVRPPDAAIMELVLPDQDGVEVVRSIRAWSDMPILLVSAVAEEAEKVRALEAGADDYLTKPFGPDELVARIRALLRRAARGRTEPKIVIGELELDLAAHTVTASGEPVHLTPTEFALLRTLVRNRGRLMTHSDLLREVWGPTYEGDAALLRTHVANLRHKIEPEPSKPRYLTTDPRIGYRFAAEHAGGS
jgi:two-component system, OmpR family, KDP operon response regulator KdpE